MGFENFIGGGEMQKIEPNEKQRKFILRIMAGHTPIPKTSDELIEMLLKFLKGYDHEDFESELISLSEKCYLSTAKVKGDELGFTYRSGIHQVLNKRSYFYALSIIMSNSQLNAMQEIEKKLLSLGYIARHGKQVRVTVAGDKYLEYLKQSLSKEF